MRSDLVEAALHHLQADGSLNRAMLSGALREAAAEIDKLREALERIADCRGAEGYGWDITKLNKALNAALPLIGREPPPDPFEGKRPKSLRSALNTEAR